MSTSHLWKEEYKTGISVIDNQHYQLFCKIEHLLSIVQNGMRDNQKTECLALLSFLTDYTTEHFATEEDWQQSHNYVDYERHARIHAQFSNTVSYYQIKIKQDFSEKTVKGFLGTLLTWLSVHVRDCDKKIKDNIPLSDRESFESAIHFLPASAAYLLTDICKISIKDSNISMYKGYIDGDIFIRTRFTDTLKCQFLCGFSNSLAGVVFERFSGTPCKPLDRLTPADQAVFMDISKKITDFALSVLSKEQETDDNCKRQLYLHEYSAMDGQTNNNVLLHVATEFGDMELLFCYY